MSDDDMTRVMVDIETLGTEPGAAILSIGAVQFGPDYVDKDMGYYEEITLQSNEKAGLTFEADTIEWWLNQANAETALTGGVELIEAIQSFTDFVTYHDPDEVWANSPSFDCRLLGAAFDAVDVELPWAYYEERDFRTLKNLPGVEAYPKTDDTVKHDAFDDAVVQARAASSILQSLHFD